MRYKLVVCDFDGTLARADHTVSDHTKNILKRYIDRGGYVAVATGRLFSAIEPYLKELGLTGYAIVYQGGAVFDIASGKPVLESPVGKKTAEKVLSVLEEDAGVIPAIYYGDKCYFDEQNQWSEAFAEILKIRPVYLEEQLSRYVKREDISPAKILALADAAYSEPFADKMRAEFADTISVKRSAPTLVEITDPAVGKGKAVAWLAGQLGIKREEVMAFGDSENDLSMIEYAGLGVAMGNAMPTLLKKADYVAKSNMEDGVAKTIEKFCLGERYE